MTAMERAQAASERDVVNLDGREASKIAGVCQKTLRYSDCPKVFVGRRVLYPKHLLIEWINRQARSEK